MPLSLGADTLTLFPKTEVVVLAPSFGDFRIEEGLEGVLSEASSIAMVGILGMEVLGDFKPGAIGVSCEPDCW